MDALIYAAGGVVRREAADGLEVALVHRPRLGDWSLPKGKLRNGEHPMVAACREVWEETGVRPSVGPRLPTVTYRVANGDGEAEKTVDYWAMAVAGDDGFVAGPETDALAWLPVPQALIRLTYERDIIVLDAFAALPPLRTPVVLLRHATAGSSDRWSRPDAERPLDRAGLARALALAETLRCFAPIRLVSATPRRCVDTLAPLAAATGLAIEVEPAFDETADPHAAAVAVHGYPDAGVAGATIVCSQGKLMPGLLAALAGGAATHYTTAKGEGWVLSLDDGGELAALDPLV